MATLYETIRRWADGQNALNCCDAARRQALQTAITVFVTSLRRHGSLADLAVAYYGDDRWWRRIGEEFALIGDEADAVRNAGHWQRFMEIRHPREAPRR